MKNKVLFVATVLRGHILVFHLPYMRWFQEQGYEVHLCCRNDTPDVHPSVPYCDRLIELPFERSPLNRKNLRVYKDLKQLIDTERYAMIHCNTPTGGMLGRLAAAAARKKGTKVVYTAHGFHFFKGAPLRNQLIYYPAEKYLSQFTDLLITINREDYEAAKTFHAKEVALVHGVGVDLYRFSKPIQRKAIRDELRLSENARVIITVGEHTKRKNHQVLIQAMTEMPENTHLLLCGVGELLKEHIRCARELGLQDRIHFLGFRTDIPDLLRASDVFAFPSLQEGLPVAQMEAMAAGLACVVSNVRGNRDLISDGVGGYLVEPNDVHSFAQKLTLLLSNPSEAREMGERNRSVMEQYSLASVLKEVTALYRKLLRGDSLES